MTRLLPCEVCARHVRVTETCCPFCLAVLDFTDVPPLVVVPGRFSRTAMLALTASVGATLFVDCESVAYSEYGAPGPNVDAFALDASDADDAADASDASTDQTVIAA